MAAGKIQWDKTGEHFYETGVDHCVLYPYSKTRAESSDADVKKTAYGPGVAWNGVSSISESPSGAEASPVYADNIKYLNLVSNEEFGATIEAYTFPDEFAVLDGSESIGAGGVIGQQSRGLFGVSYRTKLGNDVDDDNYGYKLHLVYGCKAAPSEKQYQTTNDSPEAATMSWEINTTPVNVDIPEALKTTFAGKNFKPTSIITIDSTKANATGLAALEKALYGSDAASGSEATEAYLPLPGEVMTLLAMQG